MPPILKSFSHGRSQMPRKHFSLCSLALFLGLAGCIANGPEPEARKNPELKEIPGESKRLEKPKPQDVKIVWQETPEEAKQNFKVLLQTSEGDVVLEVHPSASPLGAAQFKAAIEDGVFDGARFFRVIDGFMAQFGIAGDPAKAAIWDQKNIKDEPRKQTNVRRTLTYAKSSMPNSRSTQLFINYKDNSFLDADGFAPFAEVISGMEAVDKLYSGYGDGFPEGRGPAQDRVQAEGNAFLEKNYPELDYIIKATVITEPTGDQPAADVKPAAEVKPQAEVMPQPEVKPAAEASVVPENPPAVEKPVEAPAAAPENKPAETP